MKTPFDHAGNTFEATRPWQPAAFIVVVLLSIAAVVAFLTLAWFMLNTSGKG